MKTKPKDLFDILRDIQLKIEELQELFGESTFLDYIFEDILQLIKSEFKVERDDEVADFLIYDYAIGDKTKAYTIKELAKHAVNK